MPPFLTCIKGTLEFVYFVSLYLVIEVLTFLIIFFCSTVLTHWLTRTVLFLFLVEKKRDAEFSAACDIIQCTFCIWLLSVMTLEWLGTWSHLVMPTKLVRFQDTEHPIFHAWLWQYLGVSLTVVCTWFHTNCYFNKFYKTMPAEEANLTLAQQVISKELIEQMKYHNDLRFVVVLNIQAYVCVKAFRHFREGERRSVRTICDRLGEILMRPQGTLLMEYYYGLMGYEIFISCLIMLSVTGLGVIMQEDNQLYQSLPYMITISATICLGVMIGDIEEHLPWLDNEMEKTYRYYRIIHWNARGHFIYFIILPVLGITYFRNASDFKPGTKGQLLHNLLHLSLVSTIWFNFTKGNVLYSCVINGHFWHEQRQNQTSGTQTGGGGSQGRDRRRLQSRVGGEIDTTNRVTPTQTGLPPAYELAESQEDDSDQEVVRQEGGNVVMLGNKLLGMALGVRDFLRHYVPVPRTQSASDHGSISTGTCTSLLNRQRRGTQRRHRVAEPCFDTLVPPPRIPELEAALQDEEEVRPQDQLLTPTPAFLLNPRRMDDSGNAEGAISIDSGTTLVVCFDDNKNEMTNLHESKEVVVTFSAEMEGSTGFTQSLSTTFPAIE